MAPTLQQKLDLGILRVDEKGRIVRVPLRNPFALRIPETMPEEKVQQFVQDSQRLQELGRILDKGNDDDAIQLEVTNLFSSLKRMSTQLELVPVERYSRAQDLTGQKFFCDCCFLPLKWKNGPRIPKGQTDGEKLERLSVLSDEQLQALVDMTVREREYIAGLEPAELKKGRNYFSHNPGSDVLHALGPGASLAIDIRNSLKHLVDVNNSNHENPKDKMTFTVVDDTRLTQITVKMQKGRNKPAYFVIVPFGVPVVPEGINNPIFIGSSEKLGHLQSLVIRGLTRARVDINRVHEQFQAGGSNSLLIQDYFIPSGTKGSRVFFTSKPITFHSAVAGLVNRTLAFVENIHEIDHPTFRYAPRFGLFSTQRRRGYKTAPANDARRMINMDRYYADRRRMVEVLIRDSIDLSVEFDDRQDWKPRFGRAAVIFPPMRQGLFTSLEWSPKDNSKKTVLNPDITLFSNPNENVPSRRVFRLEDWRDTLVVFHSRDMRTARMQSELMGQWLMDVNIRRLEAELPVIKVSRPSHKQWLENINNTRRAQGIDEVEVIDIGLYLMCHSDISRVRVNFNKYMLPQELLHEHDGTRTEGNQERLPFESSKPSGLQNFPGQAELGHGTRHIAESIDVVARHLHRPDSSSS